jgi:hypothetical protein
VPVREVESDGVRPGVQAPVGEVLSEPEDLLLELDGDLVRAPPGAPGPGLEPGFPLGVDRLMSS